MAHTVALDEGRDFRADVRRRAVAFGRDPATIKVMPGISIYLGASEAEAKSRMDALDELTPIDVAMQQLSTWLGGVDLSKYDLNGPMPSMEDNTARMAAGPAYTRLARSGGLTLHEVALRCAGSKDHLVVCGTVEQVCDTMQQWFEGEAADGFNILPPTMPGSLTEFIEQVLPELRRRGLFRKEYEGKTLRENLGLLEPISRYV